MLYEVITIQELQRQEFGYRTRTPGMKSSYDSTGFDMESLMLTADKNVINVAWIVQYRVSDPGSRRDPLLGASRHRPGG